MSLMTAAADGEDMEYSVTIKKCINGWIVEEFSAIGVLQHVATTMPEVIKMIERIIKSYEPKSH